MQWGEYFSCCKYMLHVFSLTGSKNAMSNDVDSHYDNKININIPERGVAGVLGISVVGEPNEPKSQVLVNVVEDAPDIYSV